MRSIRDDDSRPPAVEQFGSGISDSDRRRELELELIKVRAEAEAARLEARAAELELTLRRLGGDWDGLSTTEPRSEESESAGTKTTALATSGAPVPVPTSPTSEEPGFSSWDAVRSATAAACPAPTVNDSPPTAKTQVDLPEPSTRDTNSLRVDAATASPRAPKLINLDDERNRERPEAGENTGASDGETASETDDAGSLDATPTRALTDNAAVFSLLQQATAGDAIDPEAVAFDDGEDAEQRRQSPTGIMISTVAHVLLLLILAGLTLSNHQPKDQVALSASVSQPSETEMETFQIETSEPENEVTEPTPSETEYELSPLGKMKVTEFSPDTPPAQPAPAMSDLLSSQMSAMALQTDSDAKIQFCGVEGGGNHFVYLVDSSRSMRDGFESARTELLHSIDVLKPDQRFYVVFFDAEPDYMRLSDPNTNETRSAYATAQNKQALKRWAMRITKNDGRAPYDPLKFALELKPDVIFLLSDGEFPQGIEDLLREHNRQDNLFGDSGPISIVHTIGYHSREGETRMRRIAQQNQGQYRHVPRP